MNEEIFKSEKLSALKTPMMIIAWVVSGLISLSCITYFGYYMYDYSFEAYKFYFNMPDFYTFLIFISVLSPSVLFAVYLTFFYEKKKMPILFPIIFGILATPFVLGLYNRFKWGFGSVRSVFNFLLSMPFSALCALVMVSFFKGIQKKTLILLPLAVGLLIEFVGFIGTVVDLFSTEYSAIYYVMELFGVIGTTGLYLLLALFTMMTDIGGIKPVVSAPTGAPTGAEMTPEQRALINITEAYRSGRISEEEYVLRRDTILKNMNR